MYAICDKDKERAQNNFFFFIKNIAVSLEEKKARAEANGPIFLVRLKDTELLENTYLRFMIKVKGDPNPEIKL